MNSKISSVINLIIALGVVIALIAGVTSIKQYSYYIFLRWLVMTVFIYFSYESYKKKQTGRLIFYAAVAVIFNPLKKIWFQKEIWHLIDYIVAVVLAVIIIYDAIQFKKQ